MPYKRSRENYLAIASHFLVFLAFFAAMVGEGLRVEGAG